MRILAFLFCIAVAWPTPTAQARPGASAVARAKKACRKDAALHCKGLKAGGDPWIDCLEARADSLAPDCRREFVPARPSALDVCRTDLERYCMDADWTGRRVECLTANLARLTEGCATVARDLATSASVARECNGDRARLCAGVRPGEGLIDCLRKAEGLSDGCRARLDAAGGEGGGAVRAVDPEVLE